MFIARPRSPDLPCNWFNHTESFSARQYQCENLQRTAIQPCMIQFLFWTSWLYGLVLWTNLRGSDLILMQNVPNRSGLHRFRSIWKYRAIEPAFMTSRVKSCRNIAMRLKKLGIHSPFLQPIRLCFKGIWQHNHTNDQILSNGPDNQGMYLYEGHR